MIARTVKIGTPNAVAPYSELQMRLPRTAPEPMRTSAHRRTPKLPPVAMVAHFVSFMYYFYFSSCSFPSAYTRFYSNPYNYSLLYVASTSALKATPFSTLLFGILYFSLYDYCPVYISVYTVIRFYSFNAVAYSNLRISLYSVSELQQLLFNLTSYIRPQRLYNPALRPSLLDRTDSIKPSQLRTSIDCSRSQGLPQNLNKYNVIIIKQMLFPIDFKNVFILIFINILDIELKEDLSIDKL